MVEAQPKVLELFAGIGGMAAAWPHAKILAAVDINQLAATTYTKNHAHPFIVREIESLSDQQLRDYAADVWWLSPPCQPYTRRGARRDLDDPRSRPLQRLITAIDRCLPPVIALENVHGFGQSAAYQRLQTTLDSHDYHWQSIELCPSQFCWPNRRPRFYLIASHQPLPAWKPLPVYQRTVLSFLSDDAEQNPELYVARATVERYASALDRVDPHHPLAVSACFASSYGKALLHSGSYLQCNAGLRRFSPREVARLLGFADSFALEHLPLRAAWKLLGNSLSLPVARYVLSHLPGGPSESA